MQISPLPNLAPQAELGRPAIGPARAVPPVAPTQLPDAVQPFRPVDPLASVDRRLVADPSGLGPWRRHDLAAKDDPGPYGPPPAFQTSMLAHLRASLMVWPENDEQPPPPYDRAVIAPDPVRPEIDRLA